MTFDKVRFFAILATMFLGGAIEQAASGDRAGANYTFVAGLVWVGLTYLMWLRQNLQRS
ncbi:MAG TPA: hypothetical protein VGH15_02050 [Caulobacteraceae bacterium]|jgi:hypothetical protein